jgi:hypothetical protein
VKRAGGGGVGENGKRASISAFKPLLAAIRLSDTEIYIRTQNGAKYSKLEQMVTISRAKRISN